VIVLIDCERRKKKQKQKQTKKKTKQNKARQNVKQQPLHPVKISTRRFSISMTDRHRTPSQCSHIPYTEGKQMY